MELVHQNRPVRLQRQAGLAVPLESAGETTHPGTLVQAPPVLRAPFPDVHHTHPLPAPTRFVSVTGSELLVRSFVAPPGKVCLLYGDDLIFQLSLRVAAHAMLQGMPIAVVDGCNRFNVHLLSRFARERRIDPEAFLNRIFVSRGFTCYQMEQAVGDRLPAFLRRIGSTIGMIFGLLDTFYDEQAPLREVQQILRRLLDSLQAMKAGGNSILLACVEWNVLPKERNRLFTTLKTGMDAVYQLTVDQENRPRIVLEQGVTHYGTNRTDLHEHHRQRDRKLVEVPAGAP